MQINQQLPWPEWELGGLIEQDGAIRFHEICRMHSGKLERAAVKIISLPFQEGPCSGLPLKQQTDLVIKAFEQMHNLRDVPNLVRYETYSVKYVDGGCELFIRTEPLRPLRYSYGSLSKPEQVRQLGVTLCKALAACQERGVIHGGISPRSIFLGEDDSFKLDGFSGAGLVVPAPERLFLSPEVQQGKAPTHQSDVYALGMVMYWLLNERRPPFAKPLPAQLDQEMKDMCRRRLESGEKLPPPEKGSDALTQVILKACEFNARNRWQRPAQLGKQLDQLSPETAPAPTSHHEHSPAPTPGPVRHRRIPLLAGAVLAAALILSWTLWSNRAQIPEDAVEFNGHHYYIYDEPVADYEAALRWCSDLGGHMVTVTSGEENSFLYSYLIREGYDHVYLGGTDAEEDGVWVWNTHEEFQYQNWNVGEPNNDLGGESHLAMYRVLSNGSWNDLVFSTPGFQDGTPMIKGASATSQLTSGDVVYGPGALVDGDPATVWYEGVSGLGSGESVTLQFAYPSRLTGFSIMPGNQSDLDRFMASSRPAVVELCFDGESSLTFELADDCREQHFQFDEPVLADSVTVTIRSVYPGLENEHTAISELTFREENRKTGFLCEWDR